MSSSYEIHFENSSAIIDGKLLSDFSKWLTSKKLYYKYFWKEGNLIELPLKEAVLQSGSMTFMNEKYDSFLLHHYKESPRTLSIAIDPASLRELYFNNIIVEIVTELYLRLKSSRVYSCWFEGQGEEQLRPDYIGWLHVFSPERVKQVGEEKILSAPIYRAEKLSDGAILIRLTRTFGEFSGDLQKKVRACLFKNEKAQ